MDNLRMLLLSKIRKTKKNPHGRIPFVQNSRKCKLTYSDRKQISGCLGTRGGEGRVGIDCKRAQGNFWGDGNVLHLTEMLVTWVYAFANAHWTGHLRRVHFIACKLYLNKVDFFLRGKNCSLDSRVLQPFLYSLSVWFQGHLWAETGSDSSLGFSPPSNPWSLAKYCQTQ